MTSPLPFLAALVGQDVTPEQIAAACTREGEPAPSGICEAIYRFSGLDIVARFGGIVLPTLLEIALIAVAAFVLSRLARRTIKRFSRRVADETAGIIRSRRGFNLLATTGPTDVRRATLRAETIGGVLRSVATVVIYGIAFALILGAVGIELGPLIAAAGVGGVALGFGAQSLVRDFLTGMFMLLEDQYGVGDIVDVGDAGNTIASGVVEAITLRVTRLRDVEGTVWWVPNGEIRRVGNRSQLWARSLIDVGVPYGTDIDHAITVIKRVADELWRDAQWTDQILEEPEVWGVEAFEPNQISIRLVVKVEPAQQWAVNRELRARLIDAFERAGIDLPLPQRVVWVRGGDVTTSKQQSNGVDTPST